MNRKLKHENMTTALLSELMRDAPAEAEALLQRGMTHHRLGRPAAAIADFTAALRIQAGSAEAYNNRGVCRQALGDRQRALADYDSALRLKPNYAEAYDNRGGLHYLLWQHAQAVADLSQAITLYGPAADPAVLARLHVNRGDARYHNGDANGLLDDYARAFRLAPAVAARQIVERLAKDAETNFRLLQANCDKHLKADPQDAIAHARRGLVALLIGQDADAQRDFDTFYRLHPHNPLGLLKTLIAAARRRRVEYGSVIPGDSGGANPARNNLDREPTPQDADPLAPILKQFETSP